MFATALAVLTAEFRAYLDREDADPARDLVGYRQHAVWLSRQELEQMIVELRQVIPPRLANQAAPERAQYLLSPILFPLEQPPAAPAGEPDAIFDIVTADEQRQRQERNKQERRQ